MNLFNSKKRILIIDDQEANRTAFSGHVPDGFDVQTAPDGLQGLKLAMGHAPDLIFLDLEMPVMDGFKFLAAARQQPKLADVPIIILTGHNEMVSFDKAASLGATDFIGKNVVNAQTIQDKIGKFLK